MRKFILLFTFTFFGLLTWSCDDEMPSSGSIYGMVSDAESTSPIMGAQVILSPGNITAVTGSDGTYEFQNLDAGQYKLMVSASGYNVNNRQVTVVAGESIICPQYRYFRQYRLVHQQYYRKLAFCKSG